MKTEIIVYPLKEIIDLFSKTLLKDLTEEYGLPEPDIINIYYPLAFHIQARWKLENMSREQSRRLCRICRTVKVKKQCIFESYDHTEKKLVLPFTKIEGVCQMKNRAYKVDKDFVDNLIFCLETDQTNFSLNFIEKEFSNLKTHIIKEGEKVVRDDEDPSEFFREFSRLFAFIETKKIEQASLHLLYINPEDCLVNTVIGYFLLEDSKKNVLQLEN